MLSKIPFISYQPEWKLGLPQNILLNFWLEFPKSDLTIYLPSRILEIFCQIVSTPGVCIYSLVKQRQVVCGHYHHFCSFFEVIQRRNSCMTGLFSLIFQTCSLIKQRTFLLCHHWFPQNDFLETSTEIPYYTDHVSLSKSCFSASDWLKRCFNQSQALLTCHQCGISAVVSQTSFVVKPVITSCNVASFLKLSNMLSCCEHRCVTSWSVFFLQLNG